MRRYTESMRRQEELMRRLMKNSSIRIYYCDESELVFLHLPRKMAKKNS